jgi:hypothetical protein
VAALAVFGLGLVGSAVLFNVEFGILDRWLARWAVTPGLVEEWPHSGSQARRRSHLGSRRYPRHEL